jgi:DNA-binding MarR family transcriptional regulator
MTAGLTPAASERAQHCANVLGALALAVADQTSDAISDSSGHAGSDAAALSALHQFLDRPSVDVLRRVLGLTPSGTVRLVDRLERHGLVSRGPGADGRTAALELTAAGRRAARRVADERSRVLLESLVALTDDELAEFDRLVGKVLVGRMRGPGATRWLCRMCDLDACGRAEGRCPLANEARARYA